MILHKNERKEFRGETKTRELIKILNKKERNGFRREIENTTRRDNPSV